MRTIITEVFYRDVPVGRVISQAVLTFQGEKVVGVPFEYRPGYRMVVRSSRDRGLAGIVQNFARVQKKKWKSAASKVILSPKLRLEFEERMLMLEREHMWRILATIDEFEARSVPVESGS